MISPLGAGASEDESVGSFLQIAQYAASQQGVTFGVQRLTSGTSIQLTCRAFTVAWPRSTFTMVASLLATEDIDDLVQETDEQKLQQQAWG